MLRFACGRAPCISPVLTCRRESSDTPIEDDADIENNADTPSDSRNISPSNNDSGMRKSCRTILLPKISSIAAEIEDGFPETLA